MRFRTLHALGVLALCASVQALADPWPTRPIRFVVSFAPGTTADLRTRQVAERIAKPLGQPVVVENRPGAGGTIAGAYVAQAAPDGYTLITGSIADLAIAPAVYPKLPYDPRNAFAPITQYAETAPILFARASLGVRSPQDLIALAKSRPGKLTIGSYGNGTLSHVLSLQLQQVAGIQLNHLPYKNAAQGLLDLVGGQIDLFWDYAITSAQHVKAGKLRALFVVGERRVVPFPDVPSAAEAGLAPIKHLAWAGFLAPAGTPRPIVERLNAEIVKALRAPDMEQLLRDQGSRVVTNAPDEFAAFIRREQDEMAALVEATGAKLE
jgi:tripartite-type tricarboxylate transporter receptor subunit TctC